ncbi:helix-turn-helix domain-containing protein [Xylocopilactobacillus apis]|uniref:HTH cro/C1-type domain-containing protein n=1 Tax=Xylocopilactobacillus apis TaxID=2932183 RepID=A0AAU9D8C1_9LACO|nr:helix-turn-helix transcriptional regulator [Xylocopilactobacillus apis]BDR57032.1 hypothetical protein KIMC2_15940 [Xylocopilactobacillus apis]
MKIDSLLNEELKNPEFAKKFQIESKKLSAALALYDAREEAGLTQTELAEQANTTQATISRIEQGDNISIDKLSSIANALGKKIKN